MNNGNEGKEKANFTNKCEYITSTTIRRKFGISNSTLRLWANDGKVDCIRIGKNGKRLYRAQSIQDLFGMSNTTQQFLKYIYARVSSQKQKDDLQRQVEDLQKQYPNHKVVTDIASGISFKRKGLLSILEQVLSGNVDEVVIAYRDRLCRFGYELLQYIFKKKGVKLVVLNASEHSSPETELASDLLAVTNVFVARNNGLRAARNRQKRKTVQVQDVSSQGAKKIKTSD